jgi:hypothetical protein
MAISVPLPIAKGGTGAAATGDEAFATTSATASGDFAVAIGYGATASEPDTVAVGWDATASGGESIAVGVQNQAAAQASTAVGHSNAASGFLSTAIGYNNEALSNSSNAFGYGCYAGGSASSAFGYFVNINTGNTAEFGYWPSPSVRGGAVRVASNGMASLTVSSGATKPVDGGIIYGSEDVGDLPRSSVAFRNDSGNLMVDHNASGVINESNLTPCRGQCSKMTDGTITGLSTSTYKTTGLTATLDTTTNIGTSLGTTDTFAIKNTSGKTRVLKVYASLDCTAGSNQTIGIKLAKNTTPIDATECRNNTGAHNFAKLVTNWMVSLDDDDEICLYVANHTSTTDIVMKRARITASSVD